jgi:hypothetical protein
MRPEAEALLAGDTARLAQLTPGQADARRPVPARWRASSTAVREPWRAGPLVRSRNADHL